MKKAEMENLKKGDAVVHKKYGEATVKEVIWSASDLFGVAITPTTNVGKRLLRVCSRTDIPDFLETTPRMLQFPTEKPATIQSQGDKDGQ